eukprot:CAMPEP_0206462416 /NCGR_PEP_ID=MMETSP0324_2-20121206/25971_1 /ASSEMBLY_ACC=CAM_ASM_000836 /TAXON_ID=2866 /ORGANISM="Crypthecodinium cohnii, Strain Seligo" /LENGTH=457 /DNA_ID=CAMNT_0053934579 /DNA_START=272 /DNA_END=1649 /DNA_ORIENTATION=-
MAARAQQKILPAAEDTSNSKVVAAEEEAAEAAASAEDQTAAPASGEVQGEAAASAAAAASKEEEQEEAAQEEESEAPVEVALKEPSADVENEDVDDQGDLEELSDDDENIDLDEDESMVSTNGGFEVAQEKVGEVSDNSTGLWGIWWGSCRKYGCASHFVPGQLCHCWHGCVRLSLCCSDYYSACYGPPPDDRRRRRSRRRRRHHHYDPPPEPAPRPAPQPAPAPTPVPVPVPVPAPRPSPSPSTSNGQLRTFYMYRSQNQNNYPPKNVNTANLAGVIWYLQHEVVITDPPKFGIYRILRYKVQTRAPANLLQSGMNFGVRYAYDSQDCTGPGSCHDMYQKYGHFVGCNNFDSGYPYPTEPTHFQGGIWYSIPSQGTCNGPPTGAFDCTFSYDWPPAEITLDELQGQAGRSFWDNPDDAGANERKVQAAKRLFQQKYPDTQDLPDPPCDFNYDRFWR